VSDLNHLKFSGRSLGYVQTGYKDVWCTIKFKMNSKFDKINIMPINIVTTRY